MLEKRSNYIIAGAVLSVLLAYLVYPSLTTLVLGLRLENISSFFQGWDSANIRALVNSTWIALLSVIGAGFVGTFLAYLFYRVDFPLRKVLMGVAVLPMALPPLVGVLAFLFLYGESGIIPRGLQAIFEMSEVPFSFEGLTAVWLVHVYTMYVYFYLFVSAALNQIDSGALEASSDLGASGFRTFCKVLLPQLRPALASSSIIVFMISMASFTAPLLFAGTENFLTLQIYNYKLNGDLGVSASVSVILTFICLIFLLLLEWKNSEIRKSSSKGVGRRAKKIDGMFGKVLWAGGSVTLLVVLLLPVLTVVLVAFAKEGSWTFQILPEVYTIENFTKLFNDPSVFAPIRNSLWMAGLATFGNVLFGVLASIVVVKSAIRGKMLLRLLTILPFAIPGTVIALNLIVTFNQPSPLSFGSVLVGSIWILPLAYFIRNIPLVVRATIASLETFDDRITEASKDLGAANFRTMRAIILPIIAPGIIAGTLLTFVTALGEFVSSIMLYVFNNRPISVEILSNLRLYDFGAAAAYSVFLMILVGLSAVAARMLNSRIRYTSL